MSVYRFVFVFLLAAVAVATFASCGGDGKKSGLLPEGEYPATVSGSIEFSLPEESASAVAFGLQTQTAQVSGSATLKMGEGGSFSIEEWGISGTIQTDGDTVNITATDHPKEKSTGKTGKDGTEADIYWQADVTNAETRTGTNTDPIAMSGDPLPNTPTTARLEMTNAPVDMANAAGNPVLTIGGWTMDITYDPDVVSVPDGDGGGGDGDGDGDGDEPSVLQALVEELVGCQHLAPGNSVLQKLMLLFLIAAPQSRHDDPDDPVLLVLLTDDGVAPGFAGLPALAKEPLVGATVTVTARAVSGQGLLPGEESERAVTNAQGEARAEFSIDKFGEYELTVVEVAAADGTRYQFHPDSNLSETFEVGQTCNPPQGW